MSNKAFIAIVVLLLLGAGYWFYTDSQKKGEANRLAEGSMAQDPNTVSDTSMMQVGGEVSPDNDPAMNGTWKSKEDPKFTRTFEANGTVTDRYEGDASATMSGTYMVVDPLKEPAGALGNVPATSLSGMTVLKTTWPDGNIMYFGVQSLTEANLNLVNLNGRGNILMFTKMN